MKNMKEALKRGVLIGILIALGYIFLSRTSHGNKLLMKAPAIKVINLLDGARYRLNKIPEMIKRPFSKDEPLSAQKPAGEKVALYFRDGSVMKGELLSETEIEYFILWKGSEYAVYKERIERIVRGQEASEGGSLLSDEEIARDWPYKNDVVIRLTNRSVLDARIEDVSEDKVSIVYTIDGGGYIEQDVERSKIEYLIFKPVLNQESLEIERSLKKLFPKMTFYNEGGFTIVTDSYTTWVKKYKLTLRQVYTDLYLDFFKLFKTNHPHVQNFVVIFDDYADFLEYAIADGVPGWAVAGYFMPDEQVLYLFNVLGDRFSELLFEAFVGESGRSIDTIVERIEGVVDKRYHIFIGGQAKKIKDKFWEAYSYYKGMYRGWTMSTLRHEFTHEVLHNWGLQSITISKTDADRDRLAEKKKEILEAGDYKKKAGLIKALISLRSSGDQPDFKAANSWLAEGMATYCETYPMGSQNNRWLYLYQDMVRNGQVYPIESLTYYKIGSFPGVCPDAMLYLYAQSWAFVTFLMARYPDEFMDYQIKMAKDAAEELQDIEWLLAATGKKLKVLQQEFEAYMNTYEEVEDPYIRDYMRVRSIFKD